MNEAKKYQAITLNISNASAGQNIEVVVSATGRELIGWSTGEDFQNIAGISVTSLSGDLPLLSFSINTSTVNFSTSSSSGSSDALTFNVGAYLVAGAGVESFYLKSSSDPGVEITAAIGNSKAQTVNTSQTLFPWDQV
jgi:hypothetical protein